MTDEKRLLVVIVAITTVAIVIGGWSADKGLVESIRFAILLWLWVAMLSGALWIAYLPIRYLRHRSAIRRVENRERGLGRQDPESEIVRRLQGLGPDPRKVPWWRWGF
jgi:hypothetical protein